MNRNKLNRSIRIEYSRWSRILVIDMKNRSNKLVSSRSQVVIGCSS